jgi:hypothetical protein
MTTTGGQPVDDTTPLAIFWFPLRGLQAEQEPAWILDVLLIQPPPDEWMLVEKTDVALNMGLRVAPPFCLSVGVPWDPEEQTAGGPDALLRNLVPEVTDALYALLLFKEGYFLDFEYVGRYYYMPPYSYGRFPGLYRQATLDISEEDTYTLAREEVERVSQLAALCRTYREGGADPAGLIALENFRLSYAPTLADPDRLALLFMALEALFGGFNERGEEYSRVSMPARAASAFSVDTRASIERYLAERGRRLRNEVAHGSLALGRQAIDDDLVRLRLIIRAGLTQYLSVCVQFSEGRDATLARIPEAGTPMRAFNSALATAAERGVNLGDVIAA